MSNFVDECGLNVKGGDGGAGCVSFRREPFVPNGGPDGGDGGKGGDVWLVADRNVASLIAFRDYPHRKAKSGTHGSGARRHGARGEDLIVSVPEGTTIRDHEGELVADLVHHGDRWLAAAGGEGGRGNARFVSSKRRMPGFAEQGEVGEERWLRLELRLMADVALVGFPNVGKSTFISRISRAKPRIADYPFTTLEPNLGVVRTAPDSQFPQGFEMVVADIPGLIEGASEGRGLGIRFLRHIERARVLLVLLDLAPTRPHTVEEQLEILLDELAGYRPDLLDRPRLVVASRVDLADATEDDVAAFEGLRMSAVVGTGIDAVTGHLRTLVHEARQAEPEPEAYVVHRPNVEGVRVERNPDGSFEVLGREARRAVRLSDLTNPEALAVAQERLAKLGVDAALARAGARRGNLVHIGDLSFDYEPESNLLLDDAAGTAALEAAVEESFLADEDGRRGPGGR